ncbi:HET-domain-containing protein, partial [Hyaloscypha bicolor E]
SLLPSRVIDVGPPDGSQEPFLYSSKEHSDYYLTLSHRWGDYDTVKTRLENLSDRSISMPIRTLPKSFRDAVVITRKLGLRYLWIDTLCIVQDDPSDWESQASNMANIFRNSLMTIAAAVDNCYENGHYSKNLGSFSLSQIVMNQALGRPSGVLDAGAWILQEQLLSPRVLYFTADELFWDCVCINASESYPTRIPDLVYNSHSHGRSYRSFKEATWRQIVQAYSSRDITLETDRMIATAGVVSLTEKMLNDRCIFGLWAKNLNGEQMWQELLWSVD